MYVLIAQLFWPIWLLFRYNGHTFLGMFVATVICIFLMFALWRIQWGNRNIFADAKRPYKPKGKLK